MLPKPNVKLKVLGGQNTLCDKAIVIAEGAQKYLWDDGSQKDYLEVKQSGKYRVVGTNSNGCKASDSIGIVIKRSTDTILYVTAQNPYTLNNQTYYNTGVYKQVWANAVGCDSTITMDLDMKISSLTDLANRSIKVYPNPTKDYLYLQTEPVTNVSYSFFDSMGRNIIQGRITQNIESIDLRELVNGIYYLKIENEVLKVHVVR